MNNIQGLSITELMPSLLEKDNKYRYLDLLPSKELKEYTIKCLEYSGYELTDEDMLVCEIMCDLGVLRGQIQARYNPELNHVDYIPTDVLSTMIVAAHLRSIYYDEEHPVISPFKAREELYELGKNPDNFSTQRALNDQTLQQIFQCIEAQDGPLTKVETAAPVMRSPQEDFSTAVFIAKKIKHWSR